MTTVAELGKLCTVEDMCRMFRRTKLTILAWRAKEGMPYIAIPGNKRHIVRFDLEAVRRWACANEKKIYADEKEV